MRRVVIRCDGGTDIGLGHVVRCCALADMLSTHFEIHFVVQETEDAVYAYLTSQPYSYSTLPRSKNFDKEAEELISMLGKNDIVVLDGYHFKTNYQQTIKTANHPLVVIDDLHAWHHVADVIINHADGISPSDYECESYTKLCLGLNYVLLRRPFLQHKRLAKTIDVVRKCVVSIGASDVGNITHKFAIALLQIKTLEEIYLLVSQINPHFQELEKLSASYSDRLFLFQNLTAEQLAQKIEEVDVVICPASSISLETCAIGAGLITGWTAENQLGNLEGLTNCDVCFNLGNFHEIETKEFNLNLIKAIQNNDHLNSIIKNQTNMIDGKSTDRILDVIQKLI